MLPLCTTKASVGFPSEWTPCLYCSLQTPWVLAYASLSSCALHSGCWNGCPTCITGALPEHPTPRAPQFSGLHLKGPPTEKPFLPTTPSKIMPPQSLSFLTLLCFLHSTCQHWQFIYVFLGLKEGGESIYLLVCCLCPPLELCLQYGSHQSHVALKFKLI